MDDQPIFAMVERLFFLEIVTQTFLASTLDSGVLPVERNQHAIKEFLCSVLQR